MTRVPPPALYRQILILAAPIILANAAVPLLSFTDTAVIGQTGDTAALAAIALAGVAFNLIYWSFGFLRMATTGFVAQADGAGDPEALQQEVLRALLLALATGLLLLALQTPLQWLVVHFFGASPEVNAELLTFFRIRIWDAPATLMSFAVLGTLIGLGLTKQVLLWQLLLNGVNMVLDVLLTIGFKMGIAGVAWGTLLANYLACAAGLCLIAKHAGLAHHPQLLLAQSARIFDLDKLRRFFAVNGNILLRTLALTGCFIWFSRQGARLGDDIVAANHLLLQFVSFCAFFLDGFANVAERYAGKAWGAGATQQFKNQLAAVTIISGLTALLLALLIHLGAPALLSVMSADQALRDLAGTFAWMACLYIFLSFGAFVLDGIYVGVTDSQTMRNSTLLALITMMLGSLMLLPSWGNAGLWLALISTVVVRAAVLAACLPRLLRRLQGV